MFSKELENLIEATLEDGILEDYEKAALQKRAQAEGVDLTELEIYINSILQKRKKEADAKKNAEYDHLEQKKKEDFGKRCPNCGKQVPSLALVCECGYEFKKEIHESSIQVLSDKINKIQSRKLTSDDVFRRKEEEKQRNQEVRDAITMFPVPNTKEDIMDFLALAAPNSKKKGGLWGTIIGRIEILGALAVIVFIVCLMLFGSNDGAVVGVIALIFIVFYGGAACFMIDQDSIEFNKNAVVWRAKFEQVLMKGRSLRTDTEFSQMLDYYERQMGETNSSQLSFKMLSDIFKKS